MEQQMYELWTDNIRIASCMAIDDVLILVKALYEHYYMETNMEIRIKPMMRCEEADHGHDD